MSKGVTSARGSPDCSRIRRKSVANSLSADAGWWCRSCRGTTCRAPTAHPWSSRFMNSHALDLECATIACEQGGLETRFGIQLRVARAPTMPEVANYWVRYGGDHFIGNSGIAAGYRPRWRSIAPG